MLEEIAPGHEAVVYTHADKEHMHNHIVINAVSWETGLKYNNPKENLYKIRGASDKLCQEHGLDVIKEQYAKERFTMAEYQLVERGQPLWKDELRTAVDSAKKITQSLGEMKDYLKQTYNIEMKIQGKNVSFLHPEKQKYCRGKTLGEDYTKGVIEHGYERQRESRVADERTDGRTNSRGLGLDASLFGNQHSLNADPGLSGRQGGRAQPEDRAIHPERSKGRGRTDTISERHGPVHSRASRDHQGAERGATQGHNSDTKLPGYQREGANADGRGSQITQDRTASRILGSESKEQGSSHAPAVHGGDSGRSVSDGRSHSFSRDVSPSMAPRTDGKTALDALKQLGQTAQRGLKAAEQDERHANKYRRNRRQKSRIEQQKQNSKSQGIER